MTDLVKIELSYEEIELFKFLQQHYDNIKLLSDKGVFKVKARTVYLHINPQGIIKDVDILIRCL